MKIALLGYGKMGKAIERIALQKGHEIVFISSGNLEETKLSFADVAIDFSVPEAAFQNISTCLKIGIPVVSGTTGWLEDYEKAVELCHEKSGAFLYASNFSLGVNLFFRMNQQLAEIMRNFPQFRIEIEETHHTEKKDAPSGTAISLANQIIQKTEKTGWELMENKEKNCNHHSIPIIAKRVPNVAGTHVVKYASEMDDIELKHTAHSREGFATGAILAAEWLVDKTGVFGMNDVLKNILL
ncbi:MAG TPA: 4-hydroxy-tetrahydrodipicolinate reductase [Flavobacteriaceae bacterium]|nr:4-hydroxy-tetrahydrodipicolinate reductase [Flavobacteriaceae bacterium]